jgi:hypothetical protein
VFETWAIDSKINKLKRADADITDDASAISSLNSRASDLADEYADLIQCSSAQRARSDIEALRQSSYDSNLNNASSAIKREITALEGEKAAIERQKQNG